MPKEKPPAAAVLTNETIIAALLTNGTISGAAAALGVSRAALYRHMNRDTAFLFEYKNARADILRRAEHCFTVNITAAIKTILEVMKDTETPPGTRIQAAQLIIANAARFTELVELKENNTRLELEAGAITDAAIIDAPARDPAADVAAAPGEIIGAGSDQTPGAAPGQTNTRRKRKPAAAVPAEGDPADGSGGSDHGNGTAAEGDPAAVPADGSGRKRKTAHKTEPKPAAAADQNASAPAKRKGGRKAKTPQERTEGAEGMPHS